MKQGIRRMKSRCKSRLGLLGEKQEGEMKQRLLEIRGGFVNMLGEEAPG